MVIGIIGSGNIGAALAQLLVQVGHEVVISNSRGPASLKDLVAKLGPHARAGTVTEAATSGEVVIEVTRKLKVNSTITSIRCPTVPVIW